MSPRLLAGIALATLLTSAVAHAQPRDCAPSLTHWTVQCATTHDIVVDVVACPRADLAVIAARHDTATLRIEVTPSSHGGFRRVGALALSPIGDFPDWSAVAPATRDVFDRVALCVRDAPSSQHTRASPTPPSTTHAPFAGVPWLLALAALVAMYALRKAPRAVAPWMLVTTVATYALRAALYPTAYFHQNGQGALWIDHLVGRTWLPYGPGFAEVFRLVARATPDAPEAAVFVAQSALAATQPVCAWSVARALGAGPSIAGALALCVAIDPVLGRVARSESYFSVGVSLAMLAAVALTRAPRTPWWTVAASLLLAQSVRVHPALWVPMAMVPLVTALSDDPPRARAVTLARTYALTALVVAVTSAPSLLAVLRGELASRWISAHPPHALSVALAAVALAALTLAPWRPLVAASLLALTLTTLRATDTYTLSGSPPWIIAAYARTFAPLVIACLAALSTALRRPRATHLAAVALALAACATLVARRAAWTTLPTDARELQRAWAWRARLPRGARVIYAARASPYVLALPLHATSRDAPRGVAVDLDEPAFASGPVGANTYYYRASICDTAVAGPRCDALERTLRLTPVEAFTLPAVPSMRHLPYRASVVRAGLFRVAP